MLIQLPSGSPDQPGPQNAESTSSTFEAGLRRDLASAPIVSYDATLGGPAKRTLELALTLVAAPLWLPLLGGAAAWSKLRGRGAPAIEKHERIGYGGRSFNYLRLRLSAQVAEGDAALAANDSGRGVRWREAFARLPSLFNVIRGDMALVGPAPLMREQLEPMKSARRYYLSARPGVIGVGTIIGGSEDPSQYKIYAMSWAVTTDILIAWDAVRALFDRNELWQPSFKHAAPGQSTSGVIVRRRTPAA
jgi:exopolysaccharide production protein ExoY